MADSGQTILITGATGQVGGAALRALGRPVRVLARSAVDALGTASLRTVRRGRRGGCRGVVRRSGVAAGAPWTTSTSCSWPAATTPTRWRSTSECSPWPHPTGVRHVVKLSAIGARADSPVALMRWHAAVEERLRSSAFAWTFLRPHLYMQNLLRFAGDVASAGRIAAPMGVARYPLVDTRDVGAAAAAVLRDPAAHAGATYALTGPAALSLCGRRRGTELAARPARGLRGARTGDVPLGAARRGRPAVASRRPRRDRLAPTPDADNEPTPALGTRLPRPPGHVRSRRSSPTSADHVPRGRVRASHALGPRALGRGRRRACARPVPAEVRASPTRPRRATSLRHTPRERRLRRTLAD